MRHTLLRWSVVCALLLAGGAARAQDPMGAPLGGGTDVGRAAVTSPQEKLGYASASNEEIREADRTVDRLLEAARKEGDAKAIECLVVRQTAVQALLSVSQASETSLRDALAGGRPERAEQEFRKIAVAVSKTRMLVAESQRCGAAGASQSGSTVVDWASALSETDLLLDESISSFDLGFEPPEVTPFL